MVDRDIGEAAAAMARPNEIVKSCVYCGEPAATKDHVPPKKVFLSPRPTDLITVPACQKCNGGASADDRIFRNHLAIRVGGYRSSGQARKFWTEEAMPSIRKKRGDLRQIATSAVPIECYSPGGIYLGQNFGIPFNTDAHNRVVTRVVRGLYWHHFGEPLGLETPVGITFINTSRLNWLDGLRPVLQHLIVCRIGGEAFEYAYGRATDAPLSSMWLLSFYRRHVVLVDTNFAMTHGLR
jgi:hypothetical protein